MRKTHPQNLPHYGVKHSLVRRANVILKIMEDGTMTEYDHFKSRREARRFMRTGSPRRAETRRRG